MAEEKVLIIGPGAAMTEDASWLDAGLLDLMHHCRDNGYKVLYCGDEAEAPLFAADQVYLEPVKLEYIARILRHERPAWILPYGGGHEGMKAAAQLKEKGILDECRAQVYGDALLHSPMASSVTEGATPTILSGATLDHYHTILWLAARDHTGAVAHLADGEQMETADVNDRDALLVYPSFSLDETMRLIIQREVEQFMTSMKMEGVAAFVIAIKEDGSGMPQILKVRPYLDLVTAFLEAGSGLHAGALEAELFAGKKLADLSLPARQTWFVQKPLIEETGRTCLCAYGDTLAEALTNLRITTSEVHPQDTNSLLVKAAEMDVSVLKELLSRNEDVAKVSGVSGVRESFLQELKKTCLAADSSVPYAVQTGVFDEKKETVLLTGCVDDEESARYMSAGMLEAAAALSRKANVIVLDHTMPVMRMPVPGVSVYNGRIDADSILAIHEEHPLAAVFLTFAGHQAHALAEALKEKDITVKDEPLDLFTAMNEQLDVPHVIKTEAYSAEAALAAAEKMGWPVMLEGHSGARHRAEVISNADQAEQFLQEIDADRIEVKQYIAGRMADVTALGDGRDVYVAGIIEEMEKAGVNQMDSIAVYPRCTLTEKDMAALAEYTRVIGKALHVRGFLRVRFILKEDDNILIGSVHQGYHEDIAFLEKCTGLELAESSMRVWMGDSLSACGYYGSTLPEGNGYCVRVPLFEDHGARQGGAALSPVKKSSGQAFGTDVSLYRALYKGMQASGMKLSNYGTVLVTVADSDKEEAVEVIRGFYDLGFNIIATAGTADILRKHGIRTHALAKVSDGSNEIYEALKSGLVKYVINTREAGFTTSETDGVKIRRCANENHIPVVSSLTTARAVLHVLQEITLRVRPFRRKHASGNR